MGRLKDATPQRQLVAELGLAIDRCIKSAATGGAMERRAREKLNRMLDANPRSSTAIFVLHNLGARRRAWLAAYRLARAGAKLI